VKSLVTGKTKYAFLRSLLVEVQGMSRVERTDTIQREMLGYAQSVVHRHGPRHGKAFGMSNAEHASEPQTPDMLFIHPELGEPGSNEAAPASQADAPQDQQEERLVIEPITLQESAPPTAVAEPAAAAAESVLIYVGPAEAELMEQGAAGHTRIIVPTDTRAPEIGGAIIAALTSTAAQGSAAASGRRDVPEGYAPYVDVLPDLTFRPRRIIDPTEVSDDMKDYAGVKGSK
jgi:hypothetical protein